MIKKICMISVMWTLGTFYASNAIAIEYGSLSDQSTYRCPGGVVAVGDSDRSVRETCGDPLEVTVSW